MRISAAVISVVLLSGCTSTLTKVESPIQIDRFAGVKGCFLLFNMKTNKFDKVIGDEATCKERNSASSTFKVPLAVMAFDSGVLKDENVVLKWDGKKDVREESNKDHNAKTWMSQSIVWFSQRITPKLGQKKLQKYLNDFDYGNKDLSAGITQAWLQSPSDKSALKISAYEQTEFMKKLWTDSLPASKRAMKITRDITFLEASPKGYSLNGKTGSNFYDKERKVRLGWFISHLQKGDEEYIAVTTFSDIAPSNSTQYGGMRAKEITKEILGDLGLW
ncbi:MAG TPA: penicillin-binding transpeptidase domain-containing protein [Bdellovibrionales bacterium]|nr:penicillin-binding transpeptidase domain-containing protein [Bdellovibrionales bacterium]